MASPNHGPACKVERIVEALRQSSFGQASLRQLHEAIDWCDVSLGFVPAALASVSSSSTLPDPAALRES